MTDWVVKILSGLTDNKFYGKLTLYFENGKITLARREETIKP